MFRTLALKIPTREYMSLSCFERYLFRALLLTASIQIVTGGEGFYYSPSGTSCYEQTKGTINDK